MDLGQALCVYVWWGAEGEGGRGEGRERGGGRRGERDKGVKRERRGRKKEEGPNIFLYSKPGLPGCCKVIVG